MSYISFPIEATPQELLDEAYAYIKSFAPEWRENDANLDTWILQSAALEAADLRELARDVPDTIFRYFGDTILGIPPIDAASATVTSTWTMVDTLGHTIPAGTYVTISNALGEAIPFQVVNEVTVAGGSSTTGVGAVILSAVDPGAEGSGLGGAGLSAQLLDTLIFVSAITLTGVTTGGVDAETASEYNDRLSLRAQLLSTRPILPGDFTILARDIVGVARAVAIDGYNPLHNLLTANEASIETDATGWVANANCNIARSTAQAADGSASLSLTSIAGGTMTARSAVASRKVINPGDQLSALASFRSAVSGRTIRVGISFDQQNNTFINTFWGTPSADVTTGFVQASVQNVVAPTNAYYASVYVEVQSTGGASEVHYVDKIQLRRGQGIDWVAGGTVETGLERTISVAAVDELGNNVSSTVKTQIDDLLEANREINFVINVIDPVRTTVAVSFTAKAIAGFDVPTASANAVAAIQAYLNPAAWGTDPGIESGATDTWIDKSFIRYSEIGQVISNAAGIDYWTAITIGLQGGTLAAADLVLPGPASIPVAGTITPTVT